MKLFISPSFTTPDKADGGIRRVVEAMTAYLPQHGIEIVDNIETADILNFHAGSYVEYVDKPMVSSCHGLYWTNYKWEDYYHHANRAVIEVMARAQAVTAPSNWVSHAIARGILHKPHTIYHGIDTRLWSPVPTTNKNHNYVLWNKARADIISNPNDLIEIAERMEKTQFITTIGRNTGNVKVMGTVPYPEMVTTVKNAGVYLATARETFGIGTLEALASGVPVAGWDFGGQSEIIKQGETGYLAPYGDYDALEQCVLNCFTERHRLSQNARQDALKRWGWEDKIKQYADLFWAVHNEWYKTRPKFSVIIPCHNLAKYLPAALDSVTEQTAENWECIVIDDQSTDQTAVVSESYTKKDKRIQYHKTPHNAGLCAVRNWGSQLAKGKYLMFLDADDQLTPKSLETLGDFLDVSPGAHIAYGRLDFTDETGTRYKKGDPVPAYDWIKQIAHYHQFPIGASLIRHEVIKRSGGFRLRDWRAEDAAWIARATSMGIRAAKATDEPIMIYRIRGDSKSQLEAQANPDDIDGNWLAWLGWHLAPTRQKGSEVLKAGKRPPWWLTPFGAQCVPEDPPHWNIDHHQDPLVSVIIPVGPGHDTHLIDALDSLLAQTVPYWEAIVINDSGEPIDTRYAPWAKVVNTAGRKGPSYARNLGAKVARGDLLYFLDADDFLLSGGLDAMARAWIDNNGEYYIYSNYVDLKPNGKTKPQKMKPYNQAEWKAQHAVNILIHRDDFWKVGGFDESLIGWEDWDLPLKLAISGLCGHHIKDDTFVYRIYSGNLRESAVSRQSELLELLRARYAPYYEGRLKMAKCCGGSNAAQTIIKAKQSIGLLDPGASMSAPSIHQRKVDSVRMEFTGNQTGAITFMRVNGRMLTKVYKGANTPAMKFINAHPQDVELLEITGKWKRVSRPKRVTANLPQPIPPAVNLDPAPKPAPKPIPNPAPNPASKTAVSATVAAIRLAESNGLDISLLKGSGKNGKITITDVREAIKS